VRLVVFVKINKKRNVLIPSHFTSFVMKRGNGLCLVFQIKHQCGGASFGKADNRKVEQPAHIPCNIPTLNIFLKARLLVDRGRIDWRLGTRGVGLGSQQKANQPIIATDYESSEYGEEKL
jgi:hypothetical protein